MGVALCAESISMRPSQSRLANAALVNSSSSISAKYSHCLPPRQVLHLQHKPVPAPPGFKRNLCMFAARRLRPPTWGLCPACKQGGSAWPAAKLRCWGILVVKGMSRPSRPRQSMLEHASSCCLQPSSRGTKEPAPASSSSNCDAIQGRHSRSQIHLIWHSVPDMHSVAATTHLAASSGPGADLCALGTAGAFPLPRAAAAVAAAAAALCCSRPKCSSAAALSCSMQPKDLELAMHAMHSHPVTAPITSCHVMRS